MINKTQFQINVEAELAARQYEQIQELENKWVDALLEGNKELATALRTHADKTRKEFEATNARHWELVQKIKSVAS